MKAQFRFAALSVALTAMMLRALLPAGWMPETGTLAICTIEGIVHITVDANGQPVKELPAKPGDHQLCPFSAAPNLASADASAIILSLSVAGLAQEIAASVETVSLARHTPQSPRAPPAFS